MQVRKFLGALVSYTRRLLVGGIDNRRVTVEQLQALAPEQDCSLVADTLEQFVKEVDKFYADIGPWAHDLNRGNLDEHSLHVRVDGYVEKKRILTDTRVTAMCPVLNKPVSGADPSPHFKWLVENCSDLWSAIHNIRCDIHILTTSLMMYERDLVKAIRSQRAINPRREGVDLGHKILSEANTFRRRGNGLLRMSFGKLYHLPCRLTRTLYYNGNVKRDLDTLALGLILMIENVPTDDKTLDRVIAQLRELFTSGQRYLYMGEPRLGPGSVCDPCLLNPESLTLTLVFIPLAIRDLQTDVFESFRFAFLYMLSKHIAQNFDSDLPGFEYADMAGTRKKFESISKSCKVKSSFVTRCWYRLLSWYAEIYQLSSYEVLSHLLDHLEDKTDEHAKAEFKKGLRELLAKI